MRSFKARGSTSCSRRRKQRKPAADRLSRHPVVQPERNQLVLRQERKPVEQARRRFQWQLRDDERRQRGGLDLHVRSDQTRAADGEWDLRVALYAGRAGRHGGKPRRQLPRVSLHPGKDHCAAPPPRHHLRWVGTRVRGAVTGTTLRVMQWNIQNAKGSDGVCNPDRIADTIVAQKPRSSA